MSTYLQLLKVLSDARVEFVIVGGTAAVLHGASTATYDLDVLMAFSQTNCERLLDAVRPLHPTHAHRPDRLPLSVAAHDLVQYRNLYLETDLGRLDVLGALPPIADATAIVDRALTMNVDGLSVKVISIDDLITVKAAMGRPKDKQTEIELRAIASARTGR